MSSTPVRIVIVGGVAAGAAAATRARRCNEHAQITLLEKDEHVSFANCGLPYHIGGEIAERSRLLVVTRELLQKRFNLDVRTRHQAIRINRITQTLTVINLETHDEYQLPWDKLILAPGASPFIPPIEGAYSDSAAGRVLSAGVYTLRNIADMDRICAACDSSTDRSAVVVGAGFIGLEMVEQLARRGFQTSLAELQPQILPPMDPEMVRPMQDDLRRRGVQLHLGDGIRRIILGADGAATGIELNSGTILPGGMIILGLGVRPNTELAIEAGLLMGLTGGIYTNAFMQTSDPRIYAAGDACEYTFGPTGESMRIPLAGPANRAGRLAGQHAAIGKTDEAAPVMGTAIVRLFEQTAAVTGLSQKAARRAEIPCRCVTIVAGQHAGYYPGASPIVLKLVYAPEDGRILGAQAVGREGVDKRIDVIATAMRFGATVRDLGGLDLAYAPPFGSARDPIHQAAFAACNQLDGLGDLLDPDADLTEFQVVDVRTEAEVRKAPLADCDAAIPIPVDELRQRLHELDATRPTVVSCGVGVRGHVAQRILKQHGFDRVANLSGGATLRTQAKPPADNLTNS